MALGCGATSSTPISPALQEGFCTPYDRRIHDALHELGFLVTYHSCGGTRGIGELIPGLKKEFGGRMLF